MIHPCANRFLYLAHPLVLDRALRRPDTRPTSPGHRPAQSFSDRFPRKSTLCAP
jgi:hypothetical protein